MSNKKRLKPKPKQDKPSYQRRLKRRVEARELAAKEAATLALPTVDASANVA